MAAALGTLVPAIPAQAQHREYYIRGRVLAADKTPIAGVDVRLRDVAASRTFEVKTDKLGVFKLAGLPHGVYEVELVKEGYRPGQAKWSFETPQETMQRVEVPDTVLFSQTQVQEAQRQKEAVSLTREAADKLAKGEIDAAMALAQDVLAKNPKDARAQFFLGLCYVRKKMDREAITVLTQVTELTPMFAPAYFELGTAHRRLGNLAKALAAYDKSLELDPANADAAYNAGLILFETNRVDEALARFEKALAVKPNDGDVLEMVGRGLIHQGKYDKAVEHLEKARAATSDAARIAFLDELIRTSRALIR